MASKKTDPDKLGGWNTPGEADTADTDGSAGIEYIASDPAQEKKRLKEKIQSDWRERETARIRALLLEESEEELRRKETVRSAAAALENDRESLSAAAAAAAQRRRDRQAAAAAKRAAQKAEQEKLRRQSVRLRRQTGSAAPQSYLTALALLLYSRLYRLGARVIRAFRSLGRRLRRLRCWTREQLPAYMERRWAITRAKWNRRVKELLFPYKYISRDTKQLTEELRARRGGDEEAPEYRDSFTRYFRKLEIPLNHIANFFAPLIGVAILAATLNIFLNFQFALSVEYSGKTIGYVSDESDFYAAQDDMIDRLINEEYIAPEDIIPTFQLTFVRRDEVDDTQSLSDKMISASGNDITNADGIYVEDEFLGAVSNGDEFLLYLDSILDGYRSGEENEVVQFVKTISVRSGVYPSSSVMPLYEVKNTIGTTSASKENRYIVQSGDTISAIAAANDTTSARIYEYNPDIDPDRPIIYVGQEILLAKDQTRSGLGIQVTRRETYEDDVDFPITYVENNNYAEGVTGIISAGVKGTRLVTADVTYVDGQVVNVNELSSTPLTEPVTQKMFVGTVSKYNPGTESNPNGYIWPLKNGAGWFNGSIGSYRGHTGMDIAAPMYTLVVASRSGTVEYATNYVVGNYGRQVLINHGGGVKTRYAHMSQVLVKNGQYVTQGTIIGKVGSSGNSSGPHLHFEIWINNQYVDPAKYIGYYG